MNHLAKILFLVLFTLGLNSSKAFAAPVKGKDSDSSLSLRSNIAIFKMITAPAIPAAPAKSLKKAGSVARTSNYHSIITVKPAPAG